MKDAKTRIMRNEIGKQLMELRKAKGYSLRELSELSGVHFTNIQQIEKGALNATIDTLERILAPLGAELTIKPSATC
jgi:transcriptional regulator with XRE-family HTH domain